MTTTHGGLTGVYFESGGHRLLGTLYLAKGDHPKPTAIVLHGLPGIEKNYDLALHLRDHLGWNALIFHYRGCWGSGGLYNFKTMPDDVRAALDFLGQHPLVDANKLILIGHSMGGWAAILAAVADSRVKAAAAIAAVADPRQLDLSIGLEDFTPYLPGLSDEAFLQQWAGLDAAFAPVEQVHHITLCPLLIVHAEHDETVPVQQARQLHHNAGANARLYIHPEANHGFAFHRGWLCDTVGKWVAALWQKSAC